MAEVNALSDFTVQIHALREGGMQRGTLTSFLLAWEKKPADEWRASLDELGSPKIGPEVRIKGTVENMMRPDFESKAGLIAFRKLYTWPMLSTVAFDRLG